jgi:predicted  nucleic acid-binding Zn-ribbon protein
MNTSCCSSASECQATMRTLDSKFEDTKQRLVTVMESMRTVQSIMEEQQAAHSALVQHEDAEMKKLKDASSDLEPQIKSILDLSSTIAGLKGEAAKGIGILTTHLSALDAEKSMTAVEEEKFLTDLANLRKAVNEQQTYADDDNTKADYADLEAAVVSMESKIAMVHELKNDLSTIEGTMTESSQNITSQIVALEVGRKTWEDETTVLHKDLSTKVVAEISRQQGDITATQEALKMVRYLVLL